MKVTERDWKAGCPSSTRTRPPPSATALGAKPGDLILMVGAEFRKACVSLGAVRTQLGKDLKLARTR